MTRLVETRSLYREDEYVRLLLGLSQIPHHKHLRWNEGINLGILNLSIR